jgi:cytoskeletal protein RodZ
LIHASICGIITGMKKRLALLVIPAVILSGVVVAIAHPGQVANHAVSDNPSNAPLTVDVVPESQIDPVAETATQPATTPAPTPSSTTPATTTPPADTPVVEPQTPVTPAPLEDPLEICIDSSNTTTVCLPRQSSPSSHAH